MNERTKNVARYILPSVGAMFVSFLYVVVDGIFVGQGVGPNALSSVNIAVPFTELMTALASLLTVGGASVAAIRMGRGDSKGANNAFMTSIILVIIASAVITSLGVLFPREIGYLLGANETLIEATVDYIFWYTIFAIFLTFSILLSAFVRNDNNPSLAFWGMVAGAITNIFLDWLFIFPLGLGVAGAAVASGLGQAVSCFILSFHFIRKAGCLRFQKVKLDLLLCQKVVKRGLPEFVVQLSMPATIFCYNQVVLKYLGETGLSAFSAISYLLSIMLGIFFGVSQGLQPLIGKSYGEKNIKDLNFYFRTGIIINITLSTLIYFTLLLFGNVLISAFVNDSAIIAIAHSSLKQYGFSFIPAALNIIMTTYFLSTKNTSRALIISVARGFTLNVACIYLFPIIFGASSIWFAMLAAELITSAIALFLLRAQSTEATRPVSVRA